MLDHLIITVSDYDLSKVFYLKALEPLGYEVVMEFGRGVGFGVGGKPDFFIREADPVKPAVHVAFACHDRDTVDRFYEAAIGAGGKDNGSPGLRPHYHPNYYGAFVLDQDGNNIEAVCHKEVE
jgi:catechol 2,3-dioxygenase-like lactoylglutathione lyase family enzyme